MRSFRIGFLTAAAMLLPCAVVAAQQVAGQSELGANAALQYWQAFAQMPALSDEQQKILDEWNTVSLKDPAVEKLVADAHKSMMYLHRAARLERCDWGLDYDDGVTLLLLHLTKARDLARLTALHARYEIERGNSKALRDDAFGMMALARHVGRDPAMVCVLVRHLIEDMVVDLTSPYVPQLKAKYADSKAMFDSLPPSSSVLDTFDMEREYFLVWIVRKIKEEEKRDPGAGLKLWKGLLGPTAPQALKQIQSVDQAIKLTEGVIPVYDELKKLVVLPPAEFDARYPKFKQQNMKPDTLAAFLIPKIDELLAKERRSQARIAMLLAAIAVAEGGPDQLKNIDDPFGDGPFEYRKLDAGFELKSQLKYEGQPVTLTVGR
ncbi:MAG TPA: hypothetical protein VGK58_17930 [Lacipirellulaceae bacterium]